MQTLKVDIRKLYTKSAYARLLGVTPAAVDRMVKDKRVNSVKINGSQLIIKD